MKIKIKSFCFLSICFCSSIFAQNILDTNAVLQIVSLYKPSLIPFEKAIYNPLAIVKNDTFPLNNNIFSNKYDYSNNLKFSRSFVRPEYMMFSQNEPYSPYRQSIAVASGNALLPFPSLKVNLENGNGNNWHYSLNFFHENIKNYNLDDQYRKTSYANFGLFYQKNNNDFINIVSDFENNIFSKYAAFPTLDNDKVTPIDNNLFQFYLLGLIYSKYINPKWSLIPTAHLKFNRFNTNTFEWIGDAEIKSKYMITNTSIYKNYAWENEILIKFEASSINQSKNIQQQQQFTQLSTHFLFRNDMLKTNFGLNTFVSNNTIDKNTFLWFPHIDIDYFFNGNKKFILELGITSYANNNTLYSILKNNPFLYDSITYKMSANYKYHIGLRGEKNNFLYWLSAAYYSTQNYMLFKSHTSPIGYKTFDMIYLSDLKYIELKSDFQFKYKFIEWEMFAKKMFVTNHSNDSIWGVPDYELQTKIVFFIKKRLKLNIEYINIASNWYLKPFVNDNKIRFYHCGTSEIFNLNSGIDFLVSTNFNLWIKVANILNKQNERWGSYIDIPLNFSGGFVYRFNVKALHNSIKNIR